jgi:crotonobetainyl-CoA:carnitine CoA-transferase CaiB-like acyl-CoA transferase
MHPGPLAHVRVVDLTDLRGALAGRLLADLGADVVKVEPPGGDPDRWRPPFAGRTAEAGRSLPFLYRHANKRAAVLDPDTAAGRTRFERLLAAADVLVENADFRAREHWRLDPADLRARHPHLVHAIVSDFGLHGPRAAWRLEALPAFAASGALHVSGFLDRPPCWLPGYVAHDAASAFACAGAVAALLARARDGLGQTVEVSVQEAALAGLTPWSIPVGDYVRLYPVLPTAPPRSADGNYYVLPVADGWIRVLPATPRHWRAFVALLGSPEALTGDHWDNLIVRILSVEAIRAVATDALRGRQRDAVVAEGQRLGVPIAPVHRPDEFVTAAQTRARGYFRATGFPHLGDEPVAVAPFVMSETPVALERPAPAPGQDDGDWPARSEAAAPPIVRNPAEPAPQPLAGLRVVSLAVVAVGPEIASLLGEFGAEVVKIESRVKTDPLREVALEPDAPNRAFTFNDENRGQRSLCLDLSRPEGRAFALELCARADVVVENNRGGVATRWGLDYDDVRRVRPDVIYLASQGYGRGGPLGEVQGFGPLNGAFAGVTYLWNHADAVYPGGSALNHPDHVASKLGLVAVLAALEHRRRTGRGQFIDLAQTEAAAFLMGEAYLEGPCTGSPAAPNGNRVPYACPHGVFPCDGNDRWVAIAVTSDAAWEAFVAEAGWKPEPAWTTLAGRLTASDEIERRVAAWTRSQAMEAVAARLQHAGVSAMPVLDGDDLRADAHLAARHAIVTVQHPEVGPERHAGNPMRLSRTPVVPAGPSPLLGADTARVLREWLGLAPERMTALVESGVCR